MKMKIFALIMAILCLTMLFAACSKDDACEEHVDEDKNAICDVCEAELDCEEHNDEDGDFICDVCGDKFNVTIKCATHVDEDGDKICDVCKTEFVACTDHTDADANKLCDTCGASLVAITQLEKPVVEERVDMVVNQIPTDAVISDYYQTTIPEAEKVTKLESYVDYTYPDASAQNGRFVRIDKTIYNTETHAVVYSTYSTDVIFTLTDAYFYFQSTSMSGGIKSFYRYYYTYDGSNFASLSWYSQENSEWNADGVDLTTFLYNNVKTDIAVHNPTKYGAIKVNDTLYIIDKESNVCAQTTTMNLFVDRPTFEVVSDDFGVVNKNNTLYFYDLNEWIKCTGSYEIPGYATGAQYWMLDNGKLLVQYVVVLSNNATSYDLLMNNGMNSGMKYDIVYTIVDPATAEAKNVEFGYAIVALEAIGDKNTVYNTEIDLNRVTVYPIVNDQIDRNNPMVLLVDSELNVKISETEAFDNADSFTLIANNRFLVTKFYENGQKRQDIVNEKGEFVAYLPLTANIHATYIKFEGKYYDFDMKLMLDPEAEKVGVDEQEQFLILKHYDAVTNTNTYYYFDTATAQKTQIVRNEGDALVPRDFGYIVAGYRVDPATNNRIYTMKIYDIDNKLVVEQANFEYSSISSFNPAYDGYVIYGTEYIYDAGRLVDWTSASWLLK